MSEVLSWTRDCPARHSTDTRWSGGAEAAYSTQVDDGLSGPNLDLDVSETTDRVEEELHVRHRHWDAGGQRVHHQGGPVLDHAPLRLNPVRKLSQFSSGARF